MDWIVQRHPETRWKKRGWGCDWDVWEKEVEEREREKKTMEREKERKVEEFKEKLWKGLKRGADRGEEGYESGDVCVQQPSKRARLV